MTKDEALKLALEALEAHADIGIKSDYVITAIKEALAQQETPNEIGKRVAREGGGLSSLWSAVSHDSDLPEAQRGYDEALAQPEQEPVAWRYKILDYFGRPVWTLKTPKTDIPVLESQSLYTTPPQRKPLTHEMTKQMRESCDSYEMRGAFVDGWLSAEAAHGIKVES